MSSTLSQFFQSSEKNSSQFPRINKYIADSGVTSRRKAEELIAGGKVKLNGEIITDLSTRVGPEDVVAVNDEVIDVASVDHVYIVFHKPRGCITSVSDPEGRETVMNYLPKNQRLYPVGRLDYLSEGLLLITNDGDMANMLMHPRHQVVKTYEVKVFGKMNEALLKKLKNGVDSEVGFLKPLSVRVIEDLPNKTWLEFRMGDGKNREIRRLCEANGIIVDKLKRVAIGGLSLGGIGPGKWRYIPKSDLLKLVGISKTGEKLERSGVYHSIKKSLALKKPRASLKVTFANDRKFQGYKKESYYETLKSQALVLKEKQEALMNSQQKN
jgi:23S rRNA pseudouridine2605 synthase